MIIRLYIFGILILGCMTGFARADKADLGLLIINDSSHVISGGVNESTAIRTLAAASLDANPNENWAFHADFLMLRGDNGSEDTGDIQAYSNIDEAEFERLHEVWIERRFEQNNLRIKLGNVDANSEFAFADQAGDFIHSSMGFSPTIGFLPSYPLPVISANLFFNLSNNELGLGVYSDDDNEFDEQFYIFEWQRSFSNTKVKAGGWYQTGDQERLDVGSQISDGTSGYYLVAEGQFNMPLASSKQTGWFIQAGWADDRIVEIDSHLATGLIWRGPFTENRDAMGLGISHVTISSFLDGLSSSKETAIESYYRYEFNDKISIKPDIQYIINPAANALAENALVFTFRTEISL